MSSWRCFAWRCLAWRCLAWRSLAWRCAVSLGLDGPPLLPWSAWARPSLRPAASRQRASQSLSPPAWPHLGSLASRRVRPRPPPRAPQPS
ncbi:MAG: hypothetical protein E6I33_03275 [Chloroflexi bacterium]|nr:MAG: hypothetical protein E6I33_03275 [Chloroflexota bacterium]